MCLLNSRQTQMFVSSSKKAWKPNAPRLTVRAKIVIM